MTFDVTYDLRQLKRNYLRILFRRWPILVGAIALIVWSTWEGYRREDLGAFQLFGWMAIGFLALKYGSAYIQYVRGLHQWARRKDGVTTRFEVTDDTLDMETGVGSSKVKWEAFQWVERSGELVLLGLPQRQWLTLPLDQVPDDALEAIRAQLQKAGVKEKGKARFLLSTS